MRKNTLNFLVDAVTLLVIFGMIATGLMIRFVLPPGTGGRNGGHGLVLWGMGRHDWGDVHFWTAVALFVLLLVHVALHWSWVCMTLHRLLRGAGDAGQLNAAKRNIYGIMFLVAVVLIFSGLTWYAGTAVRETYSPEIIENHPDRSGVNASEDGWDKGHGIAHDLIRGSMTLMEVEDATGVSVAALKSELGLSEDIPADERLGRLSRQHGFDMEKVRDIVAKHMPRPNR